MMCFIFLFYQVIGENGEVKFDDMKRLPFIEATINEVLRLANIGMEVPILRNSY